MQINIATIVNCSEFQIKRIGLFSICLLKILKLAKFGFNKLLKNDLT
ncbi:hypothetical protein MmmBen181_0895 [Mycoplasma mycoides subsp. mycoides]|nr:hypothetical protein MmmBen50_0824 [Mycoplasma mycoides subsp. mycoides]AME13027.1 hypothetical protein MmmBen181_0895 [Mycoplasma mycoides subsp. mycoides]